MPVKGADADPVKTLDKIIVTAAPVPINPVKLTSASPLDDPNATPPVTDKPDFTLARVTVVNPVQGPNPIVVSANSEGTLQWSDPTTINAGFDRPRAI